MSNNRKSHCNKIKCKSVLYQPVTYLMFEKSRVLYLEKFDLFFHYFNYYQLVVRTSVFRSVNSAFPQQTVNQNSLEAIDTLILAD